MKLNIEELNKGMNLQLFAEDGASTEVADGGGEDVGDNVETNDGTEETNVETNSIQQTPEQNKAFAEYRRQAESAAKQAQQYQQQLQGMDSWVEQNFGQSHGIHTWAEYQTAITQQVKQQQEQKYREQGLDPNAIREILKSDPEYQALKQQNQVLAQQQKQMQGQKQLDTELDELKKEYPDVKSYQDLFNMENYQDFESKIGKGYSLLDAYESVNRSNLKTKTKAAAKQETLNSINSKSHLKTEGDGEGEVDDVNIPKDVMENFINLGFSKKDAVAAFKKYYK